MPPKVPRFAVTLIALVMVLPALIAAGVARACTGPGFYGLEGHAFLRNWKTGDTLEILFDGVEYGGDCGITNVVDFSWDRVMIETESGAQIHDHQGRLLQEVQFGVVVAQYPRLDGDYVYFDDGTEESLYRVPLVGGSRERLADLPGPIALLGMRVSGGRVAWIEQTEDGERLTVFDAGSRAFVLHGATPPVPQNRTFADVELVAANGTALTFLVAAQDLYSYDYAANRTEFLARLPSSVQGFYVTEDASRIAYVAFTGDAFELRMLDANRNTTTVLERDFAGRNLVLRGNLFMYDQYVDLPPPILLLVVVIAGVAGTILVTAYALHRRRRV